jgi:hypothetical protein
MKPKSARPKDGPEMSRRDFARGAAIAAAIPIGLNPGGAQAPSAQPTAADAPVQAILAKYGARLSNEEKADIKRLVAQMEKTSDALKAFPLDNADEPATIFHVYRANHRLASGAGKPSRRSAR